MTGNEAPAPRASAAPASRALDATNLLRAQNLMRDTLAKGALRWGGPTRPLWFSALDVPFRARGRSGPTTTFRERFALARAAGVPPHPGGEAMDASTAARILNALQGLEDRALTPSSGSPKAKTKTPSPEETPTPCPWLGLAEGAWARVVPSTQQANAQAAYAAGTFQASVIEETGDYADMAADVAAMGLGRVRRVKQSDAWYANLLPYDEALGDLFEYGEQVRPPGELRARLLADPDSGVAWGRFAQLNALLIECAVLGLKADLGVFNGGGGREANYDPADDTDLAAAPTLDGSTAGSYTWRAITSAKPAWQVGMLIPSGEGWSTFYHSDLTASFAVGAAAEPIYQQYAVNVWPVTGDAHDPGQSAFMHEAARRKSLALAAYAQTLGEALAALDASGALGVPLADVVDTMEVGNELDSFWDKDPGTGESTRGALELGRYLALLAGPIARAVPGMRFRFELRAWSRSSARPTDTSLDGTLRWFSRVVGEGIVAEVRRWNLVQTQQVDFVYQLLGLRTSSAFAWEPGVREWLASCDSAAYSWPPSAIDLSGLTTQAERVRAALAARAALTPFSAGDLLHEVGVHWYHGTDTNSLGKPDITNYADLNQLHEDLGQMAATARSYGFVLSTNVGEIGYHAYAPGKATSVSSFYLAGASPRYQAAAVVQAMAVAVGSGATSASVFTFKLGTTSTTSYTSGYTLATFGKFTTMGVRNDVQVGFSFQRDQDQYPREVWFAIRRLSWLLSQVSAVSVEYAARGLTAVRFDFGKAGLATAPDGTSLSGAWRYGYLLWIDPYADSTDIHDATDLGTDPMYVAFSDPTDEGYESTSPFGLVPAVTPQTTAEDFPDYFLDDNGYVDVSHATRPNPNWTWSGWDAANGGIESKTGAFILTLRAADFASVLAPVFLLTNADIKGIV